VGADFLKHCLDDCQGFGDTMKLTQYNVYIPAWGSDLCNLRERAGGREREREERRNFAPGKPPRTLFLIHSCFYPSSSTEMLN
jgi:hypothetical protein